MQKNNIYSSVQRRKMRNFCGYQRKAVVVIPTDEEYNQRLSMHNAIERNVSESDLTEMKGIYYIRSVCMRACVHVCVACARAYI